jgi:hypothetical protein
VWCIDKIERVDLIRRIPDHNEPVYSFKHAIVQEVVYAGLLKKDRRAIHEKIARTLEICLSVAWTASWRPWRCIMPTATIHKGRRIFDPFR